MALVAGLLGMAYFVYGKRRPSFTFMLTGIGLMVFPYLVSRLWLELLVAAVLAALPFVISD